MLILLLTNADLSDGAGPDGVSLSDEVECVPHVLRLLWDQGDAPHPVLLQALVNQLHIADFHYLQRHMTKFYFFLPSVGETDALGSGVF
jgi:hypothetical protein